MIHNDLINLKPERVWRYFSEILTIPRPSKKEEKIIEYLIEFGKKHNLETVKDNCGNIVIRKPAPKFLEKKPIVILQSHIDMVCEKNSNSNHNFDTDPIIPIIEDGWVKAKDTTLGADDGIGMAIQLALLESNDILHGPIECLFTVDEETGLTGAFGLDPKFLKGRILLNLDSEDEGELFIGCAGGNETYAIFDVEKEKSPQGYEAIKINVNGLTGGHSGDDIHKGRGNAVKIINRILWHAGVKHDLRLSFFKGGNLHNAIAREAEAIALISSYKKADFDKWIKEFSSEIINEYKTTEKELKISSENCETPDEVFKKHFQKQLLNALYACPHGVIEWSREIPDFVETSTNLAAIEPEDKKIKITTSQRSSVASSLIDVNSMVAATFALAGAEYQHTKGYPGWTPNPDSKIMKLSKIVYKDLFNTDPKVLAIHAGLECGVIGEKYPGMDMISYGPTIKGAHSPDERLNISTVEKCWHFTIELLKRV